MFTRMVVPITLVALAGCSRQQSTTNNAQPPVQAVNTQPATPPAIRPVAAPSPADARGTATVRERSQVVPVSTIAAAPVTSARNYPVVSAEVADTRPPELGRPSAFAPREKPQIVHTVKTSTQPQEPTVAIPAGTRIRVRLAQTIDTKTARPGDRFVATLDYPIITGGRVIVPRGTPFEGIIEESKSSGRFRGRAVIMLRLTSFRLQGATHRVATSSATEVSGNHKKRNLAFMGGGPAAGASIGAIAAGGAGALIGAGAGAVAGTTTALITGKKNVKLPVETPMVFSLRSGVALGRS